MLSSNSASSAPISASSSMTRACRWRGKVSDWRNEVSITKAAATLWPPNDAHVHIYSFASLILASVLISLKDWKRRRSTVIERGVATSVLAAALQSKFGIYSGDCGNYADTGRP